MEASNEVLTVTLAMDDDGRRASVLEMLNEMGVRALQTRIGISITDKAVLAQGDVIVLDPADDAASLVHIVHEIYKLFPAKGTLPIIGMLSTSQWELNPRFSFWLIDGHAAISILLTYDRPDFLVNLRNMIYRLTNTRPDSASDQRG